MKFTNTKRGYFDQQGKRLPSVTTVLAKFKDPEGLVHWAYKIGLAGKDLEQEKGSAAAIGTAVHESIERWAIGIRDFNHLEELKLEELGQAKQALVNFNEWLHTVNIKPKFIELSLVDFENRFGGTIDLVCTNKENEILVFDWKTSKALYPDYLVQIGAYVHLFENGVPQNQEVEGVERKVKTANLLRIDKENGIFTHYSFSRETIQIGIDQFLLFRKAYDNFWNITKLMK